MSSLGRNRTRRAALSAAEGAIGRPVNPVVYSHEEFCQKFESGNPFVFRLLSSKRIFLIGEKMRSSEQLQGLEKIGRVNPHAATVVEVRQYLDDAKDFLTGLGGRRYEGRLGPLHKTWMESAKLRVGTVSWIRRDGKPFFRVGKNLRFLEIKLGWILVG